MYHVSAQGVDECMINGHYYYQECTSLHYHSNFSSSLSGSSKWGKAWSVAKCWLLCDHCPAGGLMLQHMQNKAHLCHEGNVLFHNLGRDGWRAMLQAAVLMINAASVDRVEVDLLTVTGYKQQKPFLSAEKTLYAWGNGLVGCLAAGKVGFLTLCEDET